jgi:hypothetical protein
MSDPIVAHTEPAKLDTYSSVDAITFQAQGAVAKSNNDVGSSLPLLLTRSTPRDAPAEVAITARRIKERQERLKLRQGLPAPSFGLAPPLAPEQLKAMLHVHAEDRKLMQIRRTADDPDGLVHDADKMLFRLAATPVQSSKDVQRLFNGSPESTRFNSF